MNLLIVEDNPDIVANLFAYFEPLGHTLDTARTGDAGLQSAARNSYDAVILDLTMPGMDGLELCRRLREQYRVATPVLMLTARDTEQDKLAGFQAGADDYLVKPYSLRELDARLKALLRRARNELVQYVLRFDDLELDTGTGQATRSGKPLALTPTGYKILLALLRHAPKLLSREALEREVWGDHPPESDALRTHIHALRQALDKPFERPMLLTRPGAGYRLVGRDEA
ncbi:response regulator transcription factor [Noviherbaspirillum sp. L7-7A]|uniref:response regulator transcription factor n=1 Tax=Noviherbaspirillum sp. L7-7A TaxID=2850560 RepID=UPI001C2C23D9|nr:response regulator transcription factor [Noviherbaspirillum sp. L7-7A]MBV0881816.1 response regulator transcription factor [Noviherbaspirillum sp. L7-7A]